MEIFKRGNKIVFEFPETLKRFNPYDEEADYGSYPYFTGVIMHHKENGNDYDEIGFAGTIDMDYKDKPDQISDIIVKWCEGSDSFKKKCDELGIDLIEYDNCDSCGAILMGAYAISLMKGKMCFSCENLIHD